MHVLRTCHSSRTCFVPACSCARAWRLSVVMHVCKACL
jgi:hypothetical protein